MRTIVPIFPVFQGNVPIIYFVLYHMSHGIQEVSGSIPLISTTSPENQWFSGLFLVVIVNNRCIIHIFRTGALTISSRYSPYRNRTGITTIPSGPIRPNPGLFPRKRHWKTSRLPPISPAPARADSALSCPHRHVPRCSGWLPGQRPASAFGKHRCVGSYGASEPEPPPPLSPPSETGSGRWMDCRASPAFWKIPR